MCREIEKNIDDEILIKKIMDGHIMSEYLLYNKYNEYLINYMKERYNYQENIDDIVSEVLIKVFTKLKSYNNKKTNFKSWVINILKNHMIDIWRKKEPVVIYNTETYHDKIKNNSLGVEYILSELEGINELYSNVTLTKKDKDFFEMKYVYGFSYEDISCYSGISSTTICNRVNYIKRKIKPHLNIRRGSKNSLKHMG